MYPILARYGSIFIYSYSVIWALGLLGALVLTHRLAPRQPHVRWLDGVIVTFIAALVGGRALFVVFNWAFFQQQPNEIWRLWSGGLSYHGALLAGLLALGLWSRGQDEPLARLFGLLAPGIVLLSAAGWLACLLEGCAYGRETLLSPLSANLPDAYGVYAVRYHSQLVGLALSLLALVLVLLLWRAGWRDARLFGTALATVSGAHLTASLLRGDPMPLLGPLRVDVVLDLALVIAGLVLIQYGDRRERSTEDTAVSIKKSR